MAKTIRVQGLESCAGPWGALNAGEVRALEANAAQSLVRGGLAVEVDAEDRPIVPLGQHKTVFEIDARPRLLIFTPCEIRPEPEVVAAVLGQDYLQPAYAVHWDWMITHDNPYAGREVYRNVQLAYEKMRRVALAEGYAAVWVVEADTIPPPDALTKLMETPGDVVTGLYVLRHGADVPNLLRFQVGPEVGSSLDWPEIREEKQPVLRVSGGCMGCTLIRPSALDFPFEMEERGAPDVAWMRHNWRRGRVTMARLDVQAGHKEADGAILWPKDYY